MITAMWSAKGGVGLSVVAATTAMTSARLYGDALLVDLVGDQAAVLGMSEPSSPGVRDWLASEADGPESVERLAVPIGSGLALIPPGTATSWDRSRVGELITALEAMECPVVVDCGVRGHSHIHGSDDPEPQVCGIVDVVEEFCRVGRSVLVSSPCYLALRRAVRILGDLRLASTEQPGLIVIGEPGRALDANDVASVTQLELVTTIERDPAVARCVDAGQLLVRPPRSVLRPLEGLL